MHIVVCELHQHEHLDSRYRRNINQAPTRSLCLGVTAELRSRLRYLRTRPSDRLVIAGSLIRTHIGVLALLPRMIEQGVYGEPGSRLVRNLNVFHIPFLVAAIIELRDFNHHIVGG